MSLLDCVNRLSGYEEVAVLDGYHGLKSSARQLYATPDRNCWQVDNLFLGPWRKRYPDREPAGNRINMPAWFVPPVS